MRNTDCWDKVVLMASLCFASAQAAEAYIDPGTGSVIYAVGLAPVVALLAWLGRRIVGMFIRSREKEAPEAEQEEEQC